MFGFVLPQTFLRSKQAADVRRTLVRDFEIAEISLFADKVFRYGEPEIAVLIGRRVAHEDAIRMRTRYQRVRENQIQEELMGFPAKLPDLRRLRVPVNHRPAGISASWLARRKRGGLPRVY